MKASELCQALHNMIREEGDLDIIMLDFTQPQTDTDSVWTDDIGVITQPDADGTRTCMMVIRPDYMRFDESLVDETRVYAQPRRTRQ